MNLVLLVALAGLMHATRSFAAGTGLGSAGSLLAFGYMLVSAFFAGGLFKQFRLPRLTGFIATGIVVGPESVVFAVFDQSTWNFHSCRLFVAKLSR